MTRTHAVLLGMVALTGFLAAASPAAQSAPTDPWFARVTGVDFESRRAADAPLQMDVPKKDWMVLPSSGSVLLVLASRRGDAVVLVERSVLQQALEAAKITDLFAQIEVDAVRERHPKAADFKSRLLYAGERRI